MKDHPQECTPSDQNAPTHTVNKTEINELKKSNQTGIAPVRKRESGETKTHSPFSKDGFINFVAFLTKTLQIINSDKNDEVIIDIIAQGCKSFLDYDVNTTL